MVIEHIANFFGRRRPKRPAPSVSPPDVDPAKDASPVSRRVPAKTLITWESEIRAMAADTAAWTIETGGDLFGRWQAAPIVYLATKAGPKAQRSTAHFRLDVEYLRELSEPLATNWALRYFGDWHSHHRLGLQEPSGGDGRRIRQLGRRNEFAEMAEIIVTTEGSEAEPVVRIHPWLYNLSNDAEPLPMAVRVLAGVSPVRQALIARDALPEQALDLWKCVPLERVRIGMDAEPPKLEKAPEVDATTREKVLSHLAEALTECNGEPVEHHTPAFGHIFVAKLRGDYHFAVAIEGKWPFNLLEVHRMNRADGSTEVIDAPTGLGALDAAAIVEAFRTARAREGA